MGTACLVALTAAAIVLWISGGRVFSGGTVGTFAGSSTSREPQASAANSRTDAADPTRVRHGGDLSTSTTFRRYPQRPMRGIHELPYFIAKLANTTVVGNHLFIGGFSFFVQDTKNPQTPRPMCTGCGERRISANRGLAARVCTRLPRGAGHRPGGYGAVGPGG